MLDLAKEPKATPDEIYRIRRTLEYDAMKVDPKENFPLSGKDAGGAR